MKHLMSLMILCTVSGASAALADDAPVDGEALYQRFCAECHGLEGYGNGPAAGALATKPSDLTKIADRRDGVWPMLEVMSIIDGYAKEFESREGMPVIPEIAGGDMTEFDTGNGVVQQVPAALIAVTEYLESIQFPEPESYVP